MSQTELTALQRRLLEMIKWLHEYSTSNDLEYYAIGGTLLGAIRHHGFIPWDDDIDVGMPREHYIRFQELMLNQSGQYRLETPMSPAKDYRYPASKLYDTTTTLVENMHPICKRGVYIDVFPLDGIGDTQEEAEKNYSRLDFLNKLLATRNSKVRKTRAWYKNAAICLSRMIPEALVNTKELSRRLDSLCAEHPFDSSEYVGNLLGNYGDRELCPKWVFGKPTPYRFEDTVINGAEFAEEYLSHVYGDWRALPPIEKRGVQHDFLYISFDQSYLENESTNNKA